MTAELVHRGPDGEGTFVDQELGAHLGQRRLAVVDLEGGVQPMFNEDGSIAVIFNGEIYNHAELRDELTAKGHVFQSDHSDTEVLVHGYEEWRPALPDRLNGMFAFAVLDRRRRRLTLVRDRFGKKPLYYTLNPQVFAFASEVTSLLRHPATDRTLDELSLQKLFAYGFIPAPRSQYRQIRKLPAGCWLEYELDRRELKIERYWQFRIEPLSDIPARPLETWTEELRGLLSAAVRRRLEADVPVGVFLSGGIDSSAVGLFAQQALAAGELRTFSIGFDDKSFDETPYIERMAQFLGSRHRHETIDLEQTKSLLPEVLGRLDEPLGDPSILPTYLVSKLARADVTVALSGDGGDELFAGYDPFKALRLAKTYQSLVPRPVHAAIRLAAARLPLSDRNMSLEFKLNRALRGVSYRPGLWNPVWLAALEPREIGELFAAPVDVEELYSEAIALWDDSRAEHLVDKTLEFYTNLYLMDGILTKVDRASMMVSLEARAPFLDRDVVEFARRIPHTYKLRDGETKYLLKKALTGLLPSDILHRKKKGFGIPLARWLRELPPSNRPTRLPHMDPAWLQQCWTEHCQRRRDHRQCLWNCLTLNHHLHTVRQMHAAGND